MGLVLGELVILQELRAGQRGTGLTGTVTVTCHSWQMARTVILTKSGLSCRTKEVSMDKTYLVLHTLTYATGILHRSKMMF